jgi:serine protease Do
MSHIRAIPLMGGLCLALGLTGGCRVGTETTPPGASAGSAAPAASGPASPAAHRRAPEPEPPAAIVDLEHAFENASAAIAPSVVSITSERQARDQLPPYMRPFADPDALMQGLGSGVIVDERGYILTNNHVVEGAERLRVVLHDDREYDATLVGADPQTDLAVIRIDARELVPARLAENTELRVGQWVLAAGSPFGLSKTITAGIVSAIGRGDMDITDYGDFIQTDAAVNQGNSGGPLIDLRGRVVGINTALASRDGGSNGIGFAIPISMGRAIMDQLIERGVVTRGWLGVVMGKLTPELASSFGYASTHGVLIDDIDPSGPAAKAGMRAGDIVAELDGRKVRDMSDFRNSISQAGPGKIVRLGVWRDGGLRPLDVTLSALDDAAPQGATRRPAAKPAPEPSVQPRPKAGAKPKLGLRFEDPEPALRRRLELPASGGALVTGVARGSVASEAKLQPGDVVLDVAGTAVKSAAHAEKLLGSADLEAGVRIRVQSGRYGHFAVLRKR